MARRHRSLDRVEMHHSPNPARHAGGSKSVIVLGNDEWTEKGRTSVEEAVKKILLGKARIPDYGAEEGRFFQGPVTPDGGRFKIPWPVIIVETDFHFVPYEHLSPVDDVLAARMAILKRDKFICQYCTKYGNTIDHVTPQSQGGENTWWNLATACTKCNGFKADMSLKEANDLLQTLLADPDLTEEKRASLPPSMKLIRLPFIPKNVVGLKMLEIGNVKVTND